MVSITSNFAAHDGKGNRRGTAISGVHADARDIRTTGSRVSAPPELLLASGSPRRRKLLEQLGLSFESLSVDIDEAHRAGELQEDFVQRLALEKAQAGWQRAQRGLPVLGADTVVELDGAILGKPPDKTTALAMLKMLSGREHTVLTGVALVMGRRQAQRMSRTRVRFRHISAQECETYWLSGEPCDKAGAYAIQGRAAAFVRELHGSYSGVVGLPLFETAELLREFGIRVL